jgi:hypothetical protein
MTFRTKYVNEMNGIMVDDELKKTIISQAISSATTGSSTVALKFRSKVAILVAFCVVIFFLAIGTPQIIHNGDKVSNGLPSLYKGLVITAYAEGGAPVLINPDVDFPLGGYSMLMSSVPGFPITITCEGADKISLRTSDGKLFLWLRFSSIGIARENEVIVTSGTTIYWTPLVEGAHVKKAIIELAAYKDKNKLGSSLIELKSGNGIDYTGKLTNK